MTTAPYSTQPAVAGTPLKQPETSAPPVSSASKSPRTSTKLLSPNGKQYYPIPRYNEIVEDTIEKIKSLGILKGGEYAGDEDRLANFRRNAERWNMTMEQVWGIYVSKHFDAVVQYVDDLAEGKERVRAEPLAGRIDDIIVYMLLFKAMLDERGEPLD